MHSAEQMGLPTYHAVEDILGSPYFLRARRAYVREILRIYEHDPYLNRLLNEAGRGIVSFSLLCLHAAFIEDIPETWPTMRRLQERVGLFGVSSARRVNDIVARLIKADFIAARPAPSDRRARILEPTAKLIDHDLDWLRAHYVPLDALFAHPGYARPLNRDPSYRKAHRIVGNQMAAHGARIMNMSPAVMLFMSRDAGIMILFKLMEAASAEAGAEEAPLSQTDIGDRFGISRTHVRKVLKDAEAAGLVETRACKFLPMPTLCDGFDRFFTNTASAHDLMHRLVLRPLGPEASVAPSVLAVLSHDGIK